MNKKTMILIMVVSITVVLFMSLWGMSAKENSEKILLFTPLSLLCGKGKGKGIASHQYNAIALYA